MPGVDLRYVPPTLIRPTPGGATGDGEIDGALTTNASGGSSQYVRLKQGNASWSGHPPIETGDLLLINGDDQNPTSGMNNPRINANGSLVLNAGMGQSALGAQVWVGFDSPDLPGGCYFNVGYGFAAFQISSKPSYNHGRITTYGTVSTVGEGVAPI